MSPFSIITTSWHFYRKQPALNAVLLWLLILPGTLQESMDYVPWDQGILHENGLDRAAYALATLIFSLVTLWGVAAIVLVGKRLIQNRAGRSRTSFKAVRSQAAAHILPLFFTGLLRGFVTLYWLMLFAIPALLFMVSSPECNAIIPPAIALALSDTTSGLWRTFLAIIVQCRVIFYLLPLLIPALVYSMQTLFAPIVVVSERKRYREALRRSRDVMRGHFWRTLWDVVQIAVLTIVPAVIAAGLIDLLVRSLEPRLFPLTVFVAHTLGGIAILLFTLSLIQMYGKLRDAHDGKPIQVNGDELDDEE